MDVFTHEVEREDEAAPATYWFSRVASESNLSDGPSREAFVHV